MLTQSSVEFAGYAAGLSASKDKLPNHSMMPPSYRDDDATIAAEQLGYGQRSERKWFCTGFMAAFNSSE